ncbi:MAG: ABC transporter substrate-binding protein [Bacteroidaceae bacterium]|nr:ABC transporter substrate-binding protein [Bacteroidaceae bacterium]
MNLPLKSNGGAAAAILWLAAVFFPFLSGCSGGNIAPVPTSGDTLHFRHATLLTAVRGNGYTRVDIRDPWNATHTAATYILIPRSDTLPATLPEGTLVRTPLQRAAAFSAVHAALADELGALSLVCGLCDKDYVRSSALLQALQQGLLQDFGAAMQPATERIAAAGADALFISPFRDRVPGPAERLGIPVIVCADYMEASPLARAEWVRFYGMLFGCEARADSLFATVEHAYSEWAMKTAAAKEKPTLMVDLKTGPVWYVAGGRSTMGTLYRDAGLAYLFANDTARGSVALDFERVYARCAQADCWLVKYGRAADHTYASLAADEPRYRLFRPWRERRIFGINTFATPFYEDTPFHPERLLAELVQTFHPELRTPGFRPRYVCPVSE